jgi:hypothetical protein
MLGRSTGYPSAVFGASSTDYHFVTHWRVEATRDEVTEVLGDAEALARWWPSVYLQVRVIEPGDRLGVGKVVDLHTKGFLPYTLRWRFRVVEANPPDGFALEAEGDFVGRGVWTFAQNGPYVDATYDWRIRADKPLLRRLSFLMRPLFEANHRWAMARGEESLQLELRRRRASTPEERAKVPAPPRPTWPS